MRAEKQFLVNEIKDKFEKHGSFIIYQHSNVGAHVMNGLRRGLRKAGGEFEIVRKRTFFRALTEMGIDLGVDSLEGHVGVTFAGKDPLEAVKIISKFCDDNELKMSVLRGRIDGSVYDAAQVKVLLELPNLDQMRAQFIGLLEAPMGQMVSVLNNALNGVVYCLEGKSQKSD